jgi:alkylation response protein AidB-like acyl-CoA dehydrogenase
MNIDHLLTEEQIMLRDTARDFADNELKPGASERDEKEIYPREIITKLGELGFMGVNTPEKYGGAGMDCVSYALAVEELSRGDASVGVIMSVNNSLVCYPLEKFSDEAQKQKYLKPLASGKKVGAFCLTEPESGSDAGAMTTTAVKDGNHWVLNGAKNFITTGLNCDVYLLFAVTDKLKGSKGTSAFLIDQGTPGLKQGKREKKMGIRSSDTVSIVLEDCRIPLENRIGPDGAGFRIALTALDSGRIGIASQALGIAQAALDESLKYVYERKQFGKYLAEFQAIQFKLADMETRLNAARLLVFSACRKKDIHQDFAVESSKAKLFASETASWITCQAVQIHGGYGYLKEYPVERHMRDSKITEIYEGTSEMQRLIISRNLLNRK